MAASYWQRGRVQGAQVESLHLKICSNRGRAPTNRKTLEQPIIHANLQNSSLVLGDLEACGPG